MRYQAALTLKFDGQSRRITKNILDDVLSWDTDRLLHLFDTEIEKVAGRKMEPKVINRVQGKKWVIVTWLDVRVKPTIGVRTIVYEEGLDSEIEERERKLQSVKGKISEILYDTDPDDLRRFDVPQDEYESEAEDIAELVIYAEEKLTPNLVKRVLERAFSPGFECPENVYDEIVRRLKPLLASEGYDS